MMLCSREFKGQLPKKDLHFETEYNDEPFPEQFKDAMCQPFNYKPEISKKKLGLPLINKFLPSNTDLIESLRKAKQNLLWHISW
jgi:hypothetical protein